MVSQPPLAIEVARLGSYRLVAKAEPALRGTIDGADDVPWNDVAKALALLRKTGIAKVSFYSAAARCGLRHAFIKWFSRCRFCLGKARKAGAMPFGRSRAP